MKKIELKQVFTASLLIAIGVIGRIYLRKHLLFLKLPDLHFTINGINQPIFIPADIFYFIAAISLFSGILLKGYYSFTVPIAIMMITDVFITNSYVFLFTWSGFAMIALIGYFSKKKLAFNAKSVLKISGIGMGSVIAYDIWTNFGWWLGPYYPHNLEGLIMCYTMAIPFTLWHLLSMAIALPLISIPLLYLKENKIIEPFTIKPVEKYVTVSASAFLMVISFMTVI